MSDSRRFLIISWILACSLLVHSLVWTHEGTLFREDFSNLDGWKEVFFPKIPTHTTYWVQSEEGESFLVARSDSSASLLVYRDTFDVYEFPRVRWRWKIENVYQKGDATRKDGDDYPIRIYIAFQYDPARAGIFQRAQYNAVKLLYGEYPPDSSLNYVWSSSEHVQRVIPSPYTDRSRMILIEQGDGNAGKWITEEVNILEDYQEAFGMPPPHRATIGIMNDSDDTGESSTSYVDFIMVFR